MQYDRNNCRRLESRVFFVVWGFLFLFLPLEFHGENILFRDKYVLPGTSTDSCLWSSSAQVDLSVFLLHFCPLSSLHLFLSLIIILLCLFPDFRPLFCLLLFIIFPSLALTTVHTSLNLSLPSLRVCECIRLGGSPSNRTGELVVQLPTDRRGDG